MLIQVYFMAQVNHNFCTQHVQENTSAIVRSGECEPNQLFCVSIDLKSTKHYIYDNEKHYTLK